MSEMVKLKLSDVMRGAGEELLFVAKKRDASRALLVHTMTNVAECLIMGADHAHEAKPEGED